MNGLKPIKIPSAKEKVASELRKAILSRKMKEGEILSLDSVATQLNVSITPVREAFQILARDGLIKLRQNKGAIVLGITDTYIREHYQLRAILESACAGLAAEEGVDISGIRDSYEESKAALENGDYSQYASQNREFHSEIWAAAGNKKMENMIAELRCRPAPECWQGSAPARCAAPVHGSARPVVWFLFPDPFRSPLLWNFFILK